jgi:large subunit ribosomal protein L17
MRHLVKGRKLNRTASHRRAMLTNLAVSILDKERVETTVPKAKEVRRVVERLITYGKKGDLHGRRLAARRIHDPIVLKKLFEVIAPVYKDRHGGYVRILKTRNRNGDNADMAIVELVGIGGADTVRKRRKKKKEAPGPGASKTEAAPAGEKTNEAAK